MKSYARPLIAITCGTDAGLPRRRDLYEIVVKEAGGEAVFVSPQTTVSDLSNRYDGFIIPGGRDLDASLYGESPLSQITPEETARTDFEFSLLHAIIRLQKPVLGICYGMQLINVFFQGSLYQDICRQVPESLDHSKGGHSITIEDNPVIEACESEVNSSHHQAVKQAGKGLNPFAHARDGIIEAFYGVGYGFLIGVQWHPERMQNSLTKPLLGRFIGACRAQR
jgi:putative glutamine amidotransferase